MTNHEQTNVMPSIEQLITTNVPSTVKLFTMKDVEILKEELNNTEDYKLLSNEEGYSLWQKINGEGSGKVATGIQYENPVAAESPYLRYKYCCDFDCDMDLFVDTMRDNEFRTKWDTREISREIVQIYNDPDNVLQYQVVEHLLKKGKLVIANRDLVTMYTEVWDGEVMYFLGKAVDLSDVLLADPSAVRGQMLYLGMKLEKIGDGKIRYWCIIQLDPSGWLPSYAVNWGCQTIPKEFKADLTRATQLRKQLYPDGKQYLNYYQLIGKQCVK
jgi:hypothetical protein